MVAIIGCAAAAEGDDDRRGAAGGYSIHNRWCENKKLRLPTKVTDAVINYDKQQPGDGRSHKQFSAYLTYPPKEVSQ